mmetsp:Transcript_35974/g.101274  ORF Transcript_35974/g.101274 Transcript_35974/m.101274 type:complete len:216 (-) Transcript_35974:111-758(-)|eukprot:CAMPEP_0119130876 /NCGR_PEP_ID=MMETSP1310-20130426/9016_1 /TAXON_ID=464262 /ORGANISM="Genus nov. species nov., Strain RCC2339" /LENGTH=215 /DNA_ID=CAMNT_0007121415 /DNA_START=52 /DNA_END=699 /DNA_ORIENTATION=+
MMKIVVVLIAMVLGAQAFDSKNMAKHILGAHRGSGATPAKTELNSRQDTTCEGCSIVGTSTQKISETDTFTDPISGATVRVAITGTQTVTGLAGGTGSGVFAYNAAVTVSGFPEFNQELSCRADFDYTWNLLNCVYDTTITSCSDNSNQVEDCNICDGLNTGVETSYDVDFSDNCASLELCLVGSNDPDDCALFSAGAPLYASLAVLVAGLFYSL